MTELTREYLAQQIAALFRIVSQNLTMTESERMMIADLHPVWEPGMPYKAGTIVKWGVNADGESQLYEIVSDHTSADYQLPQNTPAIYKKIGVTEDGYATWTQPYGVSDSYNLGDIVSWEGELWISTINNNTYPPGHFVGLYGWEVYVP